MEGKKTKSVIVDPSVAGASVYSKTQPQIHTTAQVHSEGIDSTKQTNPYAQYFPSFYKKELSRSKFNAFVLSIFAFVVVTLFILACVFSIKNSDPKSYWLIVIYILPVLIFFPIYFKSIYNALSFKQEAATINFKDQKALSINTTKLYKKLKVANINANWFCSLVYVLSILIFLLLVIIAWGTGTVGGIVNNPKFSDGNIFKQVFSKNFWDENNPLCIILQVKEGYVSFFVTFLALIFTFFVAVFMHIITLTSSFMRVNRIDNYYNSFVVLPEEITALKKSTNRRDMIIFCIASIIVGLIVWSVYKQMKANKNK
ncbi:MAG: hypothetical protein Ta2E_04900 [Mycoplasmoidaceae bacterium]|nr:MAG: hypothetical protein Ta2E_04900 [Mycoplasmoidaceae bacterium]